LNKLKEIWGWIVAVVGGAFGILLYILQRKGEKINALQAKVELAKAEKETDLIEAEIKHLKNNKNNLAKENKELDKSLQKVEEKRKQIAEDTKKLTDPKAIASYWNNN